MVSETESCIFCGRKPTTKEHIFSRWTHKHMAPRKPGRTLGLRGFHMVDRPRVWIHKMPGALRDWQVKCVCGGHNKSCNNGWMRKRIEDPARPILQKLFRGDATRISTAEQQRIAAWAALKAMIAEHDDGDHVTTNKTNRRYLMRHHIPPKGWGVWIGHYERQNWKAEWISGALFMAPNYWSKARLNQVPTHFNGHSVTQVIGKLFIQVLSLPKSGFVERWRFVMADGGHLFRIWPTTQYSIMWPGTAMSDREAELTASAMDRKGREIARKRMGLPVAGHEVLPTGDQSQGDN